MYILACFRDEHAHPTVWLWEKPCTLCMLCVAIKRAAILPVYFIVTLLWTSVKLSSSSYIPRTDSSIQIIEESCGWKSWSWSSPSPWHSPPTATKGQRNKKILRSSTWEKVLHFFLYKLCLYKIISSACIICTCTIQLILFIVSIHLAIASYSCLVLQAQLLNLLLHTIIIVPLVVKFKCSLPN